MTEYATPAIQVDVDATVQTLDTVKQHLLSTSDSVSQQTYTATDEKFVQAQQRTAEKTAALTKESTAALDTAKAFTQQLSELTESSAATVDNADGSSARSAFPTSTRTSSSAVTADLSTFSPTAYAETPQAAPSQRESATYEQFTPTTAPSEAGSSPTSVTSTSRIERPLVGAPETTARSTTATSSPAAAATAVAAPVESRRPTYIPTVTSTVSPTAFQDQVRTFAPKIQTSYPPAPAPTPESNRLREVLFPQTSGEGSRQPAGTVRLTQEQLRVVAEAIADNINAQQEAAAPAAAAGGAGGAPLAGGPIGVTVSSSEDYHIRVLDLCNQLANHQPPIPYAWGGGTLSGPSQGIRDGGYADVCGDYAKIGFDCSGLSRYVTYMTQGVEIPRVSQAQYAALTPVAHPMIGDLGFPAGGNPGHVVVYVGGGQVFEAQQSGTFLKYSPVQSGYVFGRTQNSPNWAIEQSGSGQGY